MSEISVTYVYTTIVKHIKWHRMVHAVVSPIIYLFFFLAFRKIIINNFVFSREIHQMVINVWAFVHMELLFSLLCLLKVMPHKTDVSIMLCTVQWFVIACSHQPATVFVAIIENWALSQQYKITRNAKSKGLMFSNGKLNSRRKLNGWHGTRKQKTEKDRIIKLCVFCVLDKQL